MNILKLCLVMFILLGSIAILSPKIQAVGYTEQMGLTYSSGTNSKGEALYGTFIQFKQPIILLNITVDSTNPFPNITVSRVYPNGSTIMVINISERSAGNNDTALIGLNVSKNEMIYISPSGTFGTTYNFNQNAGASYPYIGTIVNWTSRGYLGTNPGGVYKGLNITINIDTNTVWFWKSLGWMYQNETGGGGGNGTAPTSQYVAPLINYGDRYNFNPQEIINFSCNSATAANLTLFFSSTNPPSDIAAVQNGGTYINWTTNATQAAPTNYYFYGSCVNAYGNSNTSIIMITADSTAPFLSINTSAVNGNFQTAGNISRMTDYSGRTNLTISAYLTDDSNRLNSFEVNGTYGSTVLCAYRNESLGFNSSNYTLLFNDCSPLNWLRGINTTWNYWVSDSHTSKKINNYQNSEITNGLDFKTEYIDSVMFYCDDNVKIKANKEEDRYTFDMNFSNKNNKNRDCYVEASEKITYLPYTAYRAHLIIGDNPARGGNWWDADTDEGVTVQVTKITDYKYKITYKNSPSNFKSHSIGGLNIYRLTTSFFWAEYPHAPVFSASPNATTNGQTVTFTSQWQLNGSITNCILESNYTGVLQNYSAAPYAFDTCAPTLTISNTSNYASFTYRTFVNTSYGLMNVTPKSNIIIIHTIPTVTPTLNSPFTAGITNPTVTWTYSDVDTDTNLSWATKWYNNTIYYSAWDNLTTIGKNNFTIGDLVTVSLQVIDTFNNSLWSNISSTVQGNITNATYALNSFVGQTNPFYVNFSIYQDWTYFLAVPRYAYVSNLDLYLSGLLYNYLADTFVYQEFANYTTDGNLSSLGYYVDNGRWQYAGNMTDGNYSTGTYPTAFNAALNVTYIIPYNANFSNSKWIIKSDNPAPDIVSIYPNCSSTNQLFLGFNLDQLGGLRFFCYINGVRTTLFYNPGAVSTVYEEGINWSMKSDNLTNPNISINNVNIWNYLGTFYTITSVDVNISPINNILANGCTCANCSISGSNCNIPFKFHSDNTGILQTGITAFNYSWGIDNGSNLHLIPSNATTMTINFQSLGGVAATVNLSSLFNFGSSSFSNTKNNINTISFYIYPAWANLSYTSSFQYVDTSSNYYYNYPSGNLNNITQNFIFYTYAGATATVFTIKDNLNKQAVIPGVLCQSNIFLNGVYTDIESKYSDIKGDITFNYLPNTNYQFVCSMSGYETNTFIINPITSTTYDIFMEPSSSTSYANTFDRLAINIAPQEYYNGVNQFNLTISSFYNELQSYSYTLTYPGGTTTNSGTNQAGEALTSNINIAGASLFDNVQLDITYTLAIYGTKTLTYYYPINNQTAGTLNTPPNNDPTYGMGIIERLLIVIFGAIMIAGLCWLIGQENAGMLLAFAWSGYWCFVQFVPLWAFLPSIFIALIILSSRSQ
jgi:hypothetical protein